MGFLKANLRPKIPQTEAALNILNRYGMDGRNVRVVEHPSRSSYIQLRKKLAAGANANRFSLWVMYALYRTGLATGSHADEKGHVHVVNNETGLVRRVHEMVHGHDMSHPALKDAIKNIDEQEQKVRFWHAPREYIRFRMEEYRLTGILEGRAKFVEGLASQDSQIGTWDRWHFKFSQNGDLFAAGVTIMFTADLASEALRVGGLYAILATPFVYLGFSAVTKLAPYIIGRSFMRSVAGRVQNHGETLKITIENLPTLRELFFPGAYLKRLGLSHPSSIP